MLQSIEQLGADETIIGLPRLAYCIVICRSYSPKVVVAAQWLMNVHVYCIPVAIATIDNVNQTQNIVVSKIGSSKHIILSW